MNFGFSEAVFFIWSAVCHQGMCIQTKNSSDKILRGIYNKLIAPHEATLNIINLEELHHVCYKDTCAHIISDYALSFMGYVPQCSICVVRAFFPRTLTPVMTKRSSYLGLLKYT